MKKNNAMLTRNKRRKEREDTEQEEQKTRRESQGCDVISEQKIKLHT